MFSTYIHGRLNKVSIKEISNNLTISWGNSANLTGVMKSQGQLYLEIPLDNFLFSINGQVISSQETPLYTILTKPDRLTFFSVRESYQFLRLSIDSIHFAYLYEKYLGKEIDLQQVSHFLAFKSLESKIGLVREITPLTKEVQPSGYKAEDSGDLADHILKTLILSLSTEQVYPERPYCNTLALRAHEIIITTPCEKLSISQVCDRLGASTRSLQQGFKDVYGMGFIQYHKLYRLNRLRDYIRKNGLKFGEITTIMGMYGFTHNGRFSQEYKNAFGLLPSHEDKISASI